MFYEITDTRYNFGYKMGQIYSEKIKKAIEKDKIEIAEIGKSWDSLLIEIKEYIRITKEELPEVFEEVQGFADGAKISLEELFIDISEELFDVIEAGKCSDVVVGTDNVFVGHNNDVDPDLKDELTIVKYTNDKNHTAYLIGFNGIFPSAGFNDQLYLGGNQLIQKDVKPGIPRVLIARAILDCTSVIAATKLSTHPLRASSYNNVIVSKKRIALIEGSATRAAMTDYKGLYAHTNHYTHKKMLKYEISHRIRLSKSRLDRILKILSDKTDYNLDLIKKILSDHRSKQAICRHEKDTITMFCIVGDISKWEFEISIGNPCKNKFININQPPLELFQKI